MTTQKKQSSNSILNFLNPIESSQNRASFFDRDSGNVEKFFNQTKEGQKEKSKPSHRKEFTVFSYNHYYEQEIIRRQIKELSELIRKEIELIKQSDKSLLAQVKDIENISLNELPVKPGIYHVRFLEIILRILKTLRAKIGESKTWLQALVSKKKKRGSLFAALSKKKGTQYSLSQELQLTRAVQ